MNPRMILCCMASVAGLAAPGAVRAQVADPPAMVALPFGPAVPRALHGAAATYRQRALEHCIRHQVGKHTPTAQAIDFCRDDLAATRKAASSPRVASR